MSACEDLRIDLVEMLGRGYIIDHCIAAIQRKRQEELDKQIDEAYRVYMSDCVSTIVNSMGGKAKRFYDIVHPGAKDERSGDEIADDVIKRLGLKVVG